MHVALLDGSTVTGDELLVAVGRAPQVDGLGLESVGLEADGYVEADLHGRVPGTDWLFAIGDVNGRAPFTHMAKYQGRVTADHLLGARHRGGARRRRTALAARDLHRSAGRGRRPHARRRRSRPGCGRGSSTCRPRATPAARSTAAARAGTSRFLVDEERGVLIGATITGSEVADFLHAATIAVVGEVPIARLRHAVPAFPTRSEIWLKLLEAVDGPPKA